MGRWVFVVLVALVLLVVPLQGQTVTIGPLEAIGWDYADADLNLYQVNRFEAQYDAGAWAAVGMTVAFAANGVTTYKTTPPQPSGNHTVLLRACNQAGCGSTSPPFAFAVLSVPSTAPMNVRKIPK